MKNLFALCICLLLLAGRAEAALTAEISPQSAKLGETLTLTITDDSANRQNLPDLTPLQSDFTIVGTQRSFSYYAINGKTSHVAQWTVLLKAKKTGVLTIPALTFNQGNTNPLSVQIHEKSPKDDEMATTDTGDNQKDILLTTEINNPHPFINQQIIYTIKLYNSRRLLDYRYQPPEVENALLVPLGNSRQYQRIENDKHYMVAEQQYAIFPQKSGPLTIMPPVFTVLAYDVVPTEIKTRNKPLTITVKPAPIQDSKSWLPAREINLSDTWDSNENRLEQGATLVRTIQIEAKGLPAQFLQSLPTLDLKNEAGYRVYLEKGKQTNQVRDGDLTGKLSLKVTYLLDKPGTITLPELTVPWFNTDTGKEVIAKLPPRTLQVQPLANQPAIPDLPAAAQSSPATDKTVDIPEKTIPAATNGWLPWIIAGVFATLWLLTAGWRLLHQYGRNPLKKRYQASLKTLREACLSNHPEKAYAALLHWSRLHWPQATIINVSDIMALINDIKLTRQLQILSTALYSPHRTESSWQGAALWQAVQDFLRLKTGAQEKKAALSAINPG